MSVHVWFFMEFIVIPPAMLPLYLPDCLIVITAPLDCGSNRQQSEFCIACQMGARVCVWCHIDYLPRLFPRVWTWEHLYHHHVGACVRARFDAKTVTWPGMNARHISLGWCVWVWTPLPCILVNDTLLFFHVTRVQINRAHDLTLAERTEERTHANFCSGEITFLTPPSIMMFAKVWVGGYIWSDHTDIHGIGVGKWDES